MALRARQRATLRAGSGVSKIIVHHVCDLSGLTVHGTYYLDVSNATSMLSAGMDPAPTPETK